MAALQLVLAGGVWRRLVQLEILLECRVAAIAL